MVRFRPHEKVAVCGSAAFGTVSLSPFGQLFPLVDNAVEFRQRRTSTDMGDNDMKPSGKMDVEPEPFPLTDVDRWVLSQTDEEFHLQTWDELRVIIGRKDVFSVEFCAVLALKFEHRQDILQCPKLGRVVSSAAIFLR